MQNEQVEASSNYGRRVEGLLRWNCDDAARTVVYKSSLLAYKRQSKSTEQVDTY